MLRYLLSGLICFIHTSAGIVQQPAMQKKEALVKLMQTMRQQEKFVKAHAAEYLIWAGYSEAPLKEFLKQEKLFANEPKYRIVIWRVLAQAEKNPVKKKVWLKKIYAAYTDISGPDRIHATETLAKLKQPVAKMFPQITAKMLETDDPNLKIYALWASSYGSASRMNKNREKLINMALTDTDVIISRISAYILVKEKGLTISQWNRLSAAAFSLIKTDKRYVTFLAAALVTAPIGAGREQLVQINKLLTKNVTTYTAAQRTELSLALAEKGSEKQLNLLQGFMDDKFSAGIYHPASDAGADLHAAAAFAILKIYSRKINER